MARIRNDIEYSKTNKTNLSCCPLNKNLGVGEWNLAFLFVFMFACNLIFFFMSENSTSFFINYW